MPNPETTALITAMNAQTAALVQALQQQTTALNAALDLHYSHLSQQIALLPRADNTHRTQPWQSERP